MKLCLVIFVLLCGDSTYAQDHYPNIAETDSIIKSIDMTKGVMISISEGTIWPKGKKKPKGGFSDWNFTDTASKKLVKVVHEQSLYTYDKDVYYFFNDHLIAVTISRYNTKSTIFIPISTGRYYFQNDSLMRREEQDIFSKNTNAFITIAKIYLQEHKNNQ